MNLHGPVRAAETAGVGTAEVKLSFDDWTAGAVEPSVHKVEVTRPKAGPKPEPVSPRLVRSLVHPDRKAAISLLRYSADGRRLAVAGYPSGVIQIWDPAAGNEISRVATPPGLRGSAEYVALTADWKTAFTPHDGRKVIQTEVGGERRGRIEYAGEVRVWDVATGKPRPPVRLAPDRGASKVTVAPDGTKFITIEARSYDAKGMRYVPHAAVFRDTAGGPPIELAVGFAMAAFAPDGKTFVLTTGDLAKGQSRLRLFDAATAKERAVLADEPAAIVSWPTYSADGTRVAAGVYQHGQSASAVKVWEVAAGKPVAELRPAEQSAAVGQPGFSPDGRFVTATVAAELAHVWDVSTGAVVLTHRFGEKGFTPAVAVSPDGRLAAAVGTPGVPSRDLARDPDPADLPQPHVILYDLAARKAVETLVCPHGVPGRATFSPDGRTLAVGGSGAVHLFDLAERPARNP